MSAPSALINIQNGNAAAAAAASGAAVYVDPGANLTVALTTTTGVATWTITVNSDYGPLNGWTQTQGQNGPFTMQIGAIPVTPCKLTITSEVTDGNNVSTVTNYVYGYPSLQAPDRSVRGIAVGNINLAAANILLVAGGLANDGITSWVAGNRVLCALQTTTAQNGPYVISNVNANIAVLVRPPDWATGEVVPAGQVFECSEGTLYANTSWKVLQSGNVTVDTTNVTTLYPRTLKGFVANANGSGAVTNLYVAPNAVVMGIAASGTGAVIVAPNANINSGAGNGNFTLTTTTATTNASWVLTNW